MTRPTAPGEKWIDTRYADYEVSDLGRVWSRKSGQMLSTYLNNTNKHHTVCFWIDGRSIKRMLHNVVLESFCGARPPGQIGLHWDDDPDNNALVNLRWGTKSDNGLDAVRNGRNRNSEKIECPQGHEYTQENTWWYRRYRYCRQCRRDRARSAA